MARRRDRNAELQNRFELLAQRTDDAVTQRNAVTSREPRVFRLRDELHHIREENHFTPLFIKTIGGGR